jgi:hypothetical protein
VAAQQVFDAFGANGGGVVHAARTGRPCPQLRPSPSPTTVGLIVFCFFLPDTNALRPARWPAGSAHLHFGAVDPQGDALGGGVGEHVGQGLKPDARPVGHGEAPLCEQGPDLVDGPGHRGPVNPEHHCQYLVGELEAHTPPG